jgi:transposase
MSENEIKAKFEALEARNEIVLKLVLRCISETSKAAAMAEVILKDYAQYKSLSLGIDQRSIEIELESQSIREAMNLKKQIYADIPADLLLLAEHLTGNRLF